jgi:NAD+ diphosphatase
MPGPPALPAPHVFAGTYLDRATERRADAQWLAAALGDPATRFVPVWRDKSLLRDRHAALVTTAQVQPSLATRAPILLGEFRGAPVFALELDVPEPPVFADASFADLRLLAGTLPPADAGLLAYARAMLHWHARHRHCGVCGAPTEARSAGHVLHCPACGSETFPRIDPAIIVLVSDGERALLGRQASWPAGRYSTIAGFVEPGESLEDAVAREVLEETGVPLASIAYHSSQPWPFPASLMVGFCAAAVPGSTPRAGEELEDVRWFSRAQIAAGTPLLPPPQSISYRLIEDWYDAGRPGQLAAEPHAGRWWQGRQ